MKQPRTTEDIVILNSLGEYETVSRSTALEGQPTGQAKPGPINRCPITGEVLYQSDMIEYLGRYYSSTGLQEVIERDSLRNS